MAYTVDLSASLSTLISLLKQDSTNSYSMDVEKLTQMIESLSTDMDKIAFCSALAGRAASFAHIMKDISEKCFAQIAQMRDNSIRANNGCEQLSFFATDGALSSNMNVGFTTRTSTKVQDDKLYDALGIKPADLRALIVEAVTNSVKTKGYKDANAVEALCSCIGTSINNPRLTAALRAGYLTADGLDDIVKTSVSVQGSIDFMSSDENVHEGKSEKFDTSIVL